MPILEKREDNCPWWLSDRTIQRVSIHWHTYYELELVLSGTGTQVINSYEKRVEPGFVTLVSPRDFHRLEASTEEGLTLKTLCFQQDVLSEEVRHIFREAPTPYAIQLQGVSFQKILDKMNRLESDIYSRRKIRDLIVPREIELLVLELGEMNLSSVSFPNALSADEHEHNVQLLQPVLKYINEHLGETIRRDDIASILHFSPCYMSKFFKSTLGISLSDYITDCRMRRARSLLRHTEDSVNSIWIQCGYKHSSLFYRQFAAYYGVKPTDIERGGKQKTQ